MTVLETNVQYSTAPGASWLAIVSGALASIAITIILLWFGVGMGFSVVSPWSDSGVSASTFKIGTGLYLIVVAMLSSAIGGHIAGRLRGGWDDVHPNEIYFRDTANGFLAWALATVVGAVLLASAATGIIGSTTGGLAQAAGSAAAQSSGPLTIYVDQLLRPTGSATPTADAGAAKENRDEISRLMTAAFRSNHELTPPDKAYVAQVISQRSGLSQADAEKRIDEVVAKAKSDLDAIRKATAKLALWVVASLLVGAFSASIAAAEAGGFRDRNWRT